MTERHHPFCPADHPSSTASCQCFLSGPDPALAAALAERLREAMEVTRKWVPMPTHPHLSFPAWSTDELAAAILADGWTLAEATARESARAEKAEAERDALMRVVEAVESWRWAKGADFADRSARLVDAFDAFHDERTAGRTP